MRPGSRALRALATLAAVVVPGLVGCPEIADERPDARSEEEIDEVDDTPLRADLDADTNRDGLIDARDDAGEDVFGADGGAVLIANVDDDDRDGTRDSRDAVLSGAADLDDMTPVRVRRVLGLDGHIVRLTLSPEPARALVRVWRKDGDVLSVLLDPDLAQGEAEIVGADEDVELLVEALVPRTREWDGSLMLVLEVRTQDAVTSADTLALRAAPVVFPDNLRTPRRVFVMDIPDGIDGNAPFLSAMRDALPGRTELYTLPADYYGYDRWVQDNMELGYQSRPGPHGQVEMKTAMQLERGDYGRGLESFVPSEYLGPNQGFLYPGGAPTSHNYGGNLEVAPPVDGFPLGRLLYGGGTQGTLTGRPNHDTMNEDQVAFLNAQEVQGPAVELSSEWLAVGHIDEIFQFVPDLTPDEGGRAFKVVIASPALAREALLAVQSRGGGGLVVFAGRSASYTVDEILAAEEFLALNEAAQARIDSVQAGLQRALGLSETDFRPVPVLFDEVDGSLVAAFNPGVQNLVTVGDRLFVPDPEGPTESGVDPWQAATLAALADTDLDVVFVDVFQSYHELLGEAHCGTNVDRVPAETAWWTL